MSNPVCPGCGARLAEGAERCDLCGALLGASWQDEAAEPRTDDIPEPETDQDQEAGVYCNACGWKNPLAAKYCSRCGTKLQDVTTSGGGMAGSSGGGMADSSGGGDTAGSSGGGSRPPGSSSRPGVRPAELNEAGSLPGDTGGAADDSQMSRYVAVLIGLAVLLVVALYMITVVSKQNVSSESPLAVEAPADVRSAAVIEQYEAIPVADRYAPTVDSFRTAIGELDGEEKARAQRELVHFLTGIGRIDRAAIEQQRLAKQTGDVADWRRAGNLLYDWMETVNDERKTDVALLAIDAYKRVLEENPDDLDVRADLGWVYQYDPQNPMEAIQQTNRVLEADPDHLAANYNRGVFLLRINRVEDAVAQFEKVKQIADTDSPYYRQADAWIETVRRQREAGRGE